MKHSLYIECSQHTENDIHHALGLGGYLGGCVEVERVDLCSMIVTDDAIDDLQRVATSLMASGVEFKFS